MATIRDLLKTVELLAPAENALSYDRIGLQVGDPDAIISSGVVSLDASLASIEFARGVGANLLITHHPVIWEPVKTLMTTGYNALRLTRLIQAGVNLVAAHTNWDAAKGGVNDCLAHILGLNHVQPFGASQPKDLLKAVTFIPSGEEQPLIDALDAAGAGGIGLYRRCAFMTPGIGTFVPMEGSNPTIGAHQKIESVDEMRVEMILPAKNLERVRAALIEHHPYEEPAFEFYKVSCSDGQPLGRIGELDKPIHLEDLVRTVESSLKTKCLFWSGGKSEVQRIAVVGGAGDDEWRSAMSSGADVLVTGEVKQHIALEASESGFALVQAGHFATEQPACKTLCDRLSEFLPAVEWHLFEPEAGSAGRPSVLG